MSGRARVWGAAAAVTVAVACSGEKREAERAVRAYDDAAIAAYRTGDRSRVTEVATDREWRKVVALVDLKTSNRIVLESELQSLEVGEVRRTSPATMTVETRERWRYHDRPLDPGRPPGQVFVADMRVEYQLVREGAGPWKVDSVRTLSNDFLEPKGFRLGSGHGHGAEPADPAGSR